jgi:hypothetical protein
MASAGSGTLPHEILIDIFRLATDNDARHSSVDDPWTPFEPAYAATRQVDLCKDALRTKHSLAIVSPLFNELISPYLYEHIWIRYGSPSLLQVLETSRDSDGPGLGKFVRRVVVSSTPQEGSLAINTRIIKCCPFVERIRRPQESSAGDKILQDNINLPFLSRVDWHNTPFDSAFASAPAPQFLFLSKSLRVLILGSDNFPFIEHQDPETTMDLPNLHTLGINSSNSFGAEPRRHSLSLPSLRRLIVGRPEAIYNLFSGTLEPVARQITTLELGADPRFLRHDFVATLLGYCPNAAELYVPLATTKPMHPNEVPRVLLEFAATKRVFLRHAYTGTPNVPIGSIRPDGSVDPNALSISASSPSPSSSISSISSSTPPSASASASISTIQTPNPNPAPTPTLTSTRTRRHSDPKLDGRAIRMWSVLHEHFIGLCGPFSRFTALEEVVLCGREWRETVDDERFAGVLRVVRAKGVRVRCEDLEAGWALERAVRNLERSGEGVGVGIGSMFA